VIEFVVKGRSQNLRYRFSASAFEEWRRQTVAIRLGFAQDGLSRVDLIILLDRVVNGHPAMEGTSSRDREVLALCVFDVIVRYGEIPLDKVINITVDFVKYAKMRELKKAKGWLAVPDGKDKFVTVRMRDAPLPNLERINIWT
jgi:hypothetical protein